MDYDRLAYRLTSGGRFMQRLVIERGIPPPVQPEYRRRAGRPRLRDWSRFKVGDSAMVPTKSAARTAYAYGATHGKGFTSCKQVKGPRGWRVWRVS